MKRYEVILEVVERRAVYVNARSAEDANSIATGDDRPTIADSWIVDEKIIGGATLCDEDTA